MAKLQADGSTTTNAVGVDAPDDPTAQNAATAVMKPIKPMVSNAPTEPAPALPSLAPSNTASTQPANPDPNAYAPPPQDTTAPASAAPTGGPQSWLESNTAGGPGGQVAPSHGALPTAAPIQTPAAPAETQVDLVNRLQTENQAKITDGGASLAGGPAVGTAGMFGNQKAGTQGRIAQGGGVEDRLLQMSPKEQYETFGFTYSQNPKDWGAAGVADASGVVRRADGTVLGNSTPGETVMQDATTGRYLPLSKLKQQGWGGGIDANTPSAFAPQSPAAPTLPQAAPAGAPASGGEPATGGGRWGSIDGSGPPPGWYAPGGPGSPSGAPAGGPETAVLKPGGVRNVPTQPQGGGLPGIGPTNMPAQPVGMGAVSQTGVTPENALTNSLLSRGAGADRFKIAQDQWDAFTKATNPQYEASTRDALRKAAAGGAIGSGGLQTSLGDLASQRQLAMDTQKQNLLSEALKGTISDQFGDVGIAQQQQGFQKNQQDTAFGNDIQGRTLQEMLTSGDFNRNLQRLTAGSTGNPSDTAMTLSQLFGGQSSAAGSSLAALLSGMGQRQGQGNTGGGGGAATGGNSAGNGDFSSWLQQLLGGKQGQGAIDAATNVNVDVPDFTPQIPDFTQYR